MGNEPLNISSITLTGANPGDFAFTAGNGAGTLAPNGSQVVSLTFTPLPRIMALRAYLRTRSHPSSECFSVATQRLTTTRGLQPNGLHPGELHPDFLRARQVSCCWTSSPKSSRRGDRCGYGSRTSSFRAHETRPSTGPPASPRPRYRAGRIGLMKANRAPASPGKFASLIKQSPGGDSNSHASGARASEARASTSSATRRVVQWSVRESNPPLQLEGLVSCADRRTDLDQEPPVGGEGVEPSAFRLTT